MRRARKVAASQFGNSLFLFRAYVKSELLCFYSNRQYLLKKLFGLVVPIANFIVKIGAQRCPTLLDEGEGRVVFCFFHAANQKKALESLGLKNCVFIETGAFFKINTSNCHLGVFVSGRVLFKVLFNGVGAFVCLLVRSRKKRCKLANAIFWWNEIFVRNYTLLLLEEIRVVPFAVFLSDSFSTRNVAIIDFYKKKKVETHMVQHGLIQVPIRYKTHADYYHVWSRFERDKIAKFVSATTRFVYMQLTPKVVKDGDCSGVKETLVVLNPAWGIGLPYPKELFDTIKMLSSRFPLKIRLHPTDSRVRFQKCLNECSVNGVSISDKEWLDDLRCHSKFLVVNSTCALDILECGKPVATIARKRIGYDSLKIWRGEELMDVCSVADFEEFISAPCDSETYRKMARMTLYESEGL